MSESPDHHVHIRDAPGFNIGVADQPPKCRHSLHNHRTAQVFFVLKGRWHFFWGRWRTAREVVLDEGDIFNIPTGICRGFANIGTDYGMIMVILGGDDAGGGVTRAPQVIEAAHAHGLALSDRQPCKVIAGDGLLHDRPGFEVEFLLRGSLPDNLCSLDRQEILMPMRGHWCVTGDSSCTVFDPGDTATIPPGLPHSLSPAMTGRTCHYRAINIDDLAGPTQSC